MRDILIVLGMCVAAIVVGILLYMYGPAEMREVSNPAPSEQAAANTAEPVSGAVSIQVLDAGTNAGAAAQRKNIATYDTDGFERLWQMAHGNDGTPMPSVDFSERYVIGVFAGTKSSGGHGIEVSEVRDSGDTRTVVITLTKPGAGCMTSQALTSPYQIVTVPISMAVLSKVERTVETACQ
ncbi:protease complex subunit PrcB family protein [Patescibacteria group bacterium]|nr:protease complex subunit PrcB family protein [Patescibacteria group bacterium]